MWVYGRSRFTEMDSAGLVTVRKIEDRKSKRSGEEGRDKKEEIRH